MPTTSTRIRPVQLLASSHTDPTTQAEVQALRDKCEELADDVRALSTLVHALRTALLGEGLMEESRFGRKCLSLKGRSV